MTSRQIALFGTDEPAPEELRLQAGPLSALFVGGALRDIRLAGVEVIRGIYFLVRDRNWSTMLPELQDLRLDQGPDSFDIAFVCRGTTASDGQAFAWRGHIHGSAGTGIVFQADGSSDVDFETCRTGFVVLHPLEQVAGCRVEIEHADGAKEMSRFPDLVDPMQPFVDIAAMTHEPIPAIRATCRMSGGAWETEDHRNWMDASFKTYFRPLSLPWPYTIPKGEPVAQSVALTFSDLSGLSSVDDSGPIQVVVGDQIGTAMPTLGLAVAPEAIAAALQVVQPLTALGVQHLTFRVRTDTADLPGILRRASRLMQAVGAAGHLEIVVADRAAAAVELDLVAIGAAAAGFEPASVAVSPELDLKSYPPSVDRPPGPPLRALFEAARRSFPNVAVGGGMFSFFPELNRRRPPADAIDFVQHGTASNVHAADDRSVMETLQSLPHVFRSVHAFAPHKPYRISAANIGMPFNPYGAATTPNPHNLRLSMAGADPRQRSLFGAAYAAGYLARAAQGGPDFVSLMAPTGPFGVIGEAGPLPAYAVVQLFAGLAGGAVLQAASSDPQRVLAVAAQSNGRRTLILVNLTPATQVLAIAGLTPASLAVLDETSGGTFEERDRGGTFVLKAYAVARLQA